MPSASLRAHIVVGTMVAGGLGFWIWTAATEQRHSVALPPAVSAEQQKCREQLSYFLQFGSMRSGFLKSTSLVLYVEDGPWNQLTQEDKSTRAQTAYCAFAPSDGDFTLTVRGFKGADILKIKNGIEEAITLERSLGFFAGHAGHQKQSVP